MIEKRDLQQRVFTALADPTRRLLIEELSTRDLRTPTEFARDLPITRQAVSKHLKILEEANLITARKVGRERRYSLTPQPLAATLDWVVAVTEQWDKRLAALRDHLAAEQDDIG